MKFLQNCNLQVLLTIELKHFCIIVVAKSNSLLHRSHIIYSLKLLDYKLMMEEMHDTPAETRYYRGVQT